MTVSIESEQCNVLQEDLQLDSGAKKLKLNLLEKMLGNQFEINEGQNTTESVRDIVCGEITHYKNEPSLKWTEKPSLWWTNHQHSYPNTSTMRAKIPWNCCHFCIIWTFIKCLRMCYRWKTCCIITHICVFLHENFTPKHLSNVYKRGLSM